MTTAAAVAIRCKWCSKPQPLRIPHGVEFSFRCYDRGCGLEQTQTAQ